MIRKMRTSSNRSRATLFNFVLLMPCSLVLRILRLPKSPMKHLSLDQPISCGP